MYTSNNFESKVPWSSLEKNMAMTKVLLKLILSACFVFDKKALIKGEVSIVVFIVMAFIIYKRMTSDLIFNAGIYYALIFYETEQMWISLCVAFQIFSGQPFTLVALILVLISGALISLLIIAVVIRRKRLLTLSNPSKFTSAN